MVDDGAAGLDAVHTLSRIEALDSIGKPLKKVVDPVSRPVENGQVEVGIREPRTWCRA